MRAAGCQDKLVVRIAVHPFMLHPKPCSHKWSAHAGGIRWATPCHQKMAGEGLGRRRRWGCPRPGGRLPQTEARLPWCSAFHSAGRVRLCRGRTGSVSGACQPPLCCTFSHVVRLSSCVAHFSLALFRNVPPPQNNINSSRCNQLTWIGPPIFGTSLACRMGEFCAIVEQDSDVHVPILLLWLIRDVYVMLIFRNKDPAGCVATSSGTRHLCRCRCLYCCCAAHNQPD